MKEMNHLMQVALRKIGLAPLKSQENKVLFQNLPSDEFRIQILKALRDMHRKEMHYINMELLRLETGIVPSDVKVD
tara:strand:+ start:95 stop:322 length:228 start_codon:yes stop_codon:yes gene_type:complete